MLELYIKEQSFSFILVSILLFYDEKNLDMSNLLHVLLSQLSAILFFGGHLENGGISSG